MKIINPKYVKELGGVFSSAAFLVYSWSLIVFFWDLPSFLLRLSWGDIIAYAAYQFMFALLESITITVFIGVIGLILPTKYLRNNIKTSGVALVISFLVNSIILKETNNIFYWVSNTFPVTPLTASQIVIALWAISFIVLPIWLVMVTKKENVKVAINIFIDNLSILVSMYVILSLLGILLVIIRNLT